MPRKYRIQATTPDSKLPLSLRPHVARLYRKVYISDTAYEGLVSKAVEHDYVIEDPVRAKGLHKLIADLFKPSNEISFSDARPQDYLLPIDDVPPDERPLYRALQRNPYASQHYPMWSPPMTQADPEPDRQRLRLMKMTDDTYNAIFALAFTFEISNPNRRDHTFRAIANAALSPDHRHDGAVPTPVLTSVISATLEAIGRGWLTPSYWPDNQDRPKQRRFRRWKPEDSISFYA